MATQSTIQPYLLHIAIQHNTSQIHQHFSTKHRGRQLLPSTAVAGCSAVLLQMNATVAAVAGNSIVAVPEAWKLTWSRGCARSSNPSGPSCPKLRHGTRENPRVDLMTRALPFLCLQKWIVKEFWKHDEMWHHANQHADVGR